MVATRADFRTETANQPVRYSDFLPNFDRNPITGSLAKLTNAQSVKNALRMLVLTMLEERPFQPMVGSQVVAQLFDNYDAVLRSVLTDTLLATIRRCEPRVSVIQIRFNDTAADANSLGVTIIYSLVNTGQQDQLSVILKRTR
jgi:phage baseplate assembly protein W